MILVLLPVITEQPERDNLAQLNLIAGYKAKTAIAYEPARRYLNTGISLLTADTWCQYDLSLDLYDATIALEGNNTNYEC